MHNTFTLGSYEKQWRHDSRKTEQSIAIHTNAGHYSYPIVPWIWTDQRHLWQWDTCGELRQLASADRPPTKPRAPSLSLARSPSMRLLSSRSSHYSRPMAYVESPEKINLQFLPIRPTCSNPNPPQTRSSRSFWNAKVATDSCNGDDDCWILRSRRFESWLWRCGPLTDRTHQLRSPVSSSGKQEQRIFSESSDWTRTIPFPSNCTITIT